MCKQVFKGEMRYKLPYYSEYCPQPLLTQWQRHVHANLALVHECSTLNVVPQRGELDRRRHQTCNGHSYDMFSARKPALRQRRELHLPIVLFKQKSEKSQESTRATASRLNSPMSVKTYGSPHGIPVKEAQQMANDGDLPGNGRSPLGSHSGSRPQQNHPRWGNKTVEIVRSGYHAGVVSIKGALVYSADHVTLQPVQPKEREETRHGDAILWLNHGLVERSCKSLIERDAPTTK